MTNHEHSHKLAVKIITMRKIPFVLSGFAVHLTSHFGQSFENHSYGYAVRTIEQTVLSATLQNPDPSCNMRASAQSTSCQSRMVP